MGTSKEEKILDEIIDVLDVIGTAGADIFDGDVIWSGNTIVADYRGIPITSKYIRTRIDILKKDYSSVKRKFQLHFDNVSKITNQISDIHL